MKERLEIIDFKYKVIFWSFLFFLIVSFLSPISSNDWENYLIGSKGIKTIIDTISNAYSNSDGRIISRFLTYILACNKVIFNVIFAGLMACLVSSFSTFLGKVNNKYYYLLTIIALLTVNVYTFAENYTWLSGSITYTFPSIMTIMYITYLYKKETFSFTKMETLCLLLLNIIIPFFVENIAFAFTLGNIIIFIRRTLDHKKFSKAFLSFTIISFISLIIVLTNPGIEVEAINNIDFNSLSFIDKISTNIPNLISYVFTNNPFLLIFMLIPTNYLLHIKTKNYIYSRLMLILFNIIPLFSIICNFNSMVPVNINLIINKYDGIFLIENWYFIFYWIFLIGLFIYSVIELIPERKKRNYCLLLIMIAILSIIPLLILSSTWSYNMVILFMFIMLAVSCVLLVEMKIKIWPWLVKPIVALLIIYYITIMSLTFYINKTRENYIEEQLAVNDKLIYIKANPFHLTWEPNPICSSKNIKYFREYYKIPKNTTIEVKYFGILERIEKNVKKDIEDKENNECR